MPRYVDDLMRVAVRCALGAFIIVGLSLDGARAQAPGLLEFSYTPTERAQIAIWIEDNAGNFMGTVRLTAAVAKHGIGNRPGALQTNSGYRWPYGRRESVLPVWAHRRATAPDATLFRRVIFQNGGDEGRIARSLAEPSRFDSTRDDYFCLSGNNANNALDAVTCASVFTGDKGRFITDQDVAEGYFEPFDNDGTNTTRALDLWSVYPPRRDILETANFDHEDVANFASEALAVMPDLDAVTMATPQGGIPQVVQFETPSQWPAGDYVAFLEIHVEGDHNQAFSVDAYPTPTGTGWTDGWVTRFGYPYRGQPSVVYQVPFVLGSGGDFSTRAPRGYGEIHGLDGELRSMDASITDDPTADPGSGADRLLMSVSKRFGVRVIATAVCEGANPPPECEVTCDNDNQCGSGFLCGSAGTCVGQCDVLAQPEPVTDLSLQNHENDKWSHRVASLRFTVPQSRRAIRGYAIRESTSEIDDTTFDSADDARIPDTNLEGETIPLPGAALTVPSAVDCESSTEDFCTPFLSDATNVCPNGVDNNGDGDCLDPGDEIHVDIAFLRHETVYHLAVVALDMCQQPGPIASSSVQTTEINFTTVSPCFVATAAYGSPLADEVWALRAFRDRYLMNNRLGLSFVAAYYALGPHAADVIAERPWLATTTRIALTPLVTLARWLVH